MAPGVPSRDRPLLALSMIVKDEGRTLARTLRSAKPFIDRWFIVDTGSSDDTREVVTRELSGVPGELSEAPFVDFETTRNLALERCGDETEMILWLDADDELTGGAELRAFLEAERPRSELDREAYLVRVDTVVSFSSVRVVRSRAGWRFKGVVHEVLEHRERPTPTLRVPGAAIRHQPDGVSIERSHARRERDKKLLTLALERAPNDPRAAFYLAMTSFWLGQYDDAARAFQRRIDLGGWHEEVYQARFGLAESSEKKGDPWDQVLPLYLAAHAFAPHRAEPLHRIALHYHALGEHALALLFARRGSELPYPAHDVHFIDAEVYTWKLHDLVASSAYWIGEHALGEASARQALAHRPDDARLRQNLACYLDRKEKDGGRGPSGAQ